MTVITVNGHTHYVEPALYKRWMDLADGKLFKEDNDKSYIVAGRERSGKSLFTFQQCATIDPEFVSDFLKDGHNICFDPEDFLSAIKNTASTATRTKCIVFDEAFRGLSSRSSLSKTNRIIVQALMEMGQRNLVVFIVLPSFFMLDKYPAMIRSDGLFYVKRPKRGRKTYGRVWKGFNYNKKALLFRLGIDKGWSYNVPTRFRGKFFDKWPGGEEFRQAYLKKKAAALQSINADEIRSDKSLRWERERDFAIWFLWKHMKMKKIEIIRAFKSNGYEFSEGKLKRILEKFAVRTKKEPVSPLPLLIDKDNTMEKGTVPIQVVEHALQ